MAITINKAMPAISVISLILAFCHFTYFFNEATSFDEDDKDYWKFQYYSDTSSLIQHNVEIYVDLFLLWLLYRFMKPQKNLQDGRTEASVLLFSHDGKRAQEILLDSYTKDDEQRKVESRERN